MYVHRFSGPIPCKRWAPAGPPGTGPRDGAPCAARGDTPQTVRAETQRGRHGAHTYAAGRAGTTVANGRDMSEKLARSVPAAVAAALGVLVVLGVGCAAGGADPRPATFDFIATTILAPQCATSSCHGRVARVAGLSFETTADAFESLIDMGALEPSVVGTGPGSNVPCNPLLLATSAGPSCGGESGNVTMPPDAPLPDADVALMEQWLLDGAVYP